MYINLTAGTKMPSGIENVLSMKVPWLTPWGGRWDAKGMVRKSEQINRCLNCSVLVSQWRWGVERTEMRSNGQGIGPQVYLKIELWSQVIWIWVINVTVVVLYLSLDKKKNAWKVFIEMTLWTHRPTYNTICLSLIQRQPLLTQPIT